MADDDFDFPAELIKAERLAWEQIQAGTLTVDAALDVHTRLADLAAETGRSRLDLEVGLKRLVRHPAPETT